jgi:hypothetical protein
MLPQKEGLLVLTGKKKSYLTAEKFLTFGLKHKRNLVSFNAKK